MREPSREGSNSCASKVSNWTWALANMSQGLCMFDAKQRLVVCNKRYADLYGLTEGAGEAGYHSARKSWSIRVARGNAPVDHESYVKDRIKEVGANKPYQITHELQDGRFVCHRTSTHCKRRMGWDNMKDVTEVRRAEAARARAVEEAELFRGAGVGSRRREQRRNRTFWAVMSHEIRNADECCDWFVFGITRNPASARNSVTFANYDS